MCGVQMDIIKGIKNTIRINYCNKDDLRFEFLTGISVNDTIECENELASVKQMLQNAEVNQRKGVVGIEQGTGKK